MTFVRADGTETKYQSRLCRICSRARARRYLDKQPKRKATPLPPLPLDSDVHEVELERYIRRVVRARLAQRAPVFWEDVESRLEHHGFQVKSEPYHVPLRALALDKEAWCDYARRTRAGWEDHGDWFVSRMLADARIRKVLRAARSRYIIVEPGADRRGKARRPRGRTRPASAGRYAGLRRLKLGRQ